LPVGELAGRFPKSRATAKTAQATRAVEICEGFFMRLAMYIVWFFSLLAGPAFASAGFDVVRIPDPAGGAIEVGIWYPANASPATVHLGLGEQTVAPGAPLVGDHLPLIVISHGNGGFFGSHFDTAQALAQAGFVAAALSHTGDSYPDSSRATDMANRPRQLSVLISYMLEKWHGHARLDAARVGAFGFSSGGFTVLAATGAMTDVAAISRHCLILPALYDCQLTAAHPATPGDWHWTADSRIRAVVSAAPAVSYAFTPESLAGIRIPVQLWQAEYDHVLPAPYYVDPVRRQLPSPPEFHRVSGADHFDFLPPCSRPEDWPSICTPAPGFDRAAFHVEFNRQVVRFFQKTLR
jgi:predicted dienelactone hydrolase